MGKITGMLKEVVGEVTGDRLLARDGWKERHGIEIRHNAHSVGEKVEEILRHPTFDDGPEDIDERDDPGSTRGARG